MGWISLNMMSSKYWSIKEDMVHILLFSHCHFWLFVTPSTAACQVLLSSTISRSLHIYNGILSSHKKEWVWVIWVMSMDRESIIQSEVSQKEKNKDRACIRTLEKWYWWNYLQGRNGDAEVENGLVDTVGDGEGGTNWKSSTDIHTLPCVTQIPRGELSSVLSDGLEGWGEGVGGRPTREGLHTQLIHSVIQQKLTQHCKAIILQ